MVVDDLFYILVGLVLILQIELFESFSFGLLYGFVIDLKFLMIEIVFLQIVDDSFFAFIDEPDIVISLHEGGWLDDFNDYFSVILQEDGFVSLCEPAGLEWFSLKPIEDLLHLGM